MAPRGKSPIWETFGLEENLLGEFEHWTVLLRPKQVTPGSMVLIANRAINSMAKLRPAEGAELGKVCGALEAMLRERLGMDKINYLALMMVDAHLHFHVIPRFENDVHLANREWSDAAWPGPPDLTSATDDAELLTTLRRVLRLA